jgi:hypothetical protein
MARGGASAGEIETGVVDMVSAVYRNTVDLAGQQNVERRLIGVKPPRQTVRHPEPNRPVSLSMRRASQPIARW